MGHTMREAHQTSGEPHIKNLRRLETHNCPRSAFTLMETLVAVAIVGLLAAIVTAVGARAMVSANKVKCASNMRQIGVAILNYAGERGGKLPPTRHSATRDQAWIFQIAGYLDNVDEVRISPADPRGAERLRRGSTSYLANDLIFDQRTDAFDNVLEGSIGHLLRIDRPGRTILAFTVSDNRGTGASNDHTHSNRWNSFTEFLADVEADRHRVGGRSPNRDRGSAHYLYADGSLRTFTSEQMRDWITAGNNPGMVNSAP
jgi:prepilin-type N-terminal cleavage/methylation domain-containing protein